MISYLSALELLEQCGAARALERETVFLADAIGRVLAEDVASPEEVPSFTNSAMDGFAVRALDFRDASVENPVRIAVRGMIAAGDLGAFERATRSREDGAVEIMTGAPIPTARFDAVVRIEDVDVERDPDGCARSITVSRPVSAGDNARLQGTDYRTGQRVLREGTRIGPEQVLALASLGVARLPVRRRPRVAILSTGSELVDPGTPKLEPGLIRNSTGPFLLEAARRLGAEARYWGVVTDEAALYQRMLERILEEGADVILSTGAVSMGKFDFVPEVLGRMGARTRFHKVAIRPGKPLLFAELGGSGGGTAFFGVPGNPVSTAVGLRFFTEPYLRAALGLPRERPIRARLARECPKPAGLRCFFKGLVSADEDGIRVEALRGQASYVVSALLDASCWVVLPESESVAPAGSAVDIYPLHNAFERGVIP